MVGENGHFRIDEMTKPCDINSKNYILMLTLNSFQCMFRILILIVFDATMMTGMFPNIDNVTFGRRFQCIPNSSGSC